MCQPAFGVLRCVDGACYATTVLSFFECSFIFSCVVCCVAHWRTDCAMCAVCDSEAWAEITIKMRIVYVQMRLDK